MPLSAGTRLGRYEILSALGARGMGVYRAHDATLSRDVALKNPPSKFAQAVVNARPPNIRLVHDV
jgi:hypothetical protein